MSRFKAGDKVRYLDDGIHSPMTTGEIYTVKRAHEGGLAPGVELVEFPSGDWVRWWYDSRFELVEPEPSDIDRLLTEAEADVNAAESRAERRHAKWQDAERKAGAARKRLRALTEAEPYLRTA